jgi:uncharacterized membrane protein YedE/YeeE
MHRVVRIALAAAALAGLAYLLRQEGSPVLAPALGLLAGLAFAGSRFSFAGAWRAAALRRDVTGLTAQTALIAALGLAVMPLIAGFDVRGHVAPVGVALVLGAFLFGVGMQLARRCASGALWTAGTGDLASLAALTGIGLGATAAVVSHETWSGFAKLPAVSFTAGLGLPGALALHLTLSGMLALAILAWRGGAHGARAWVSPRLLFGAVGLLAVVVATFALTGRPWTIISSFALIGTQAAEALGHDTWSWSFWAPNLDALSVSPLMDVTTLANLGLVAGAGAFAVGFGRFRLRLDRGARELVTALTGGLMMGFGALMASGCNVASLLAAIPSGSLHGWVWLAAAFAGSTSAVLAEEALERRRARSAAPVTGAIVPAR